MKIVLNSFSFRSRFFYSTFPKFMFKKFVVPFLSVFTIVSLALSPIHAQETTIWGQAETYSGQALHFYRYSNQITYPVDTLASCKVDEAGNWKAVFNLAGTEQLYVDLGYYRGSFYAEAGKYYEIVLPEYRKKSKAESLNPLFEQPTIFLGISSTEANEVNFRIRELTFRIDSFMMVHETALIRRALSPKTLQAFIDKQYADFPPVSVFWSTQLKYELAPLKQLVHYKPAQLLLAEYFSTDSIMPNHESYMRFLKEEQNGLFAYAQRESAALNEAMNQGDWKVALSHLQAVKGFETDSWAEFFLLHVSFTRYWQGRFEGEKLVALLDSAMANSSNQFIQSLTPHIKKQILQLMPGQPAPDFKLPDANGNIVSLSDFRGKYVYLNFCSQESYPCRVNFELMQELQEEFKRKLEIVSLSGDENYRELVNNLHQKSYFWTVLDATGHAELFRTYRVKTIPSYFLIDPYGKLLLVPAPAPTENFRNEFFRVLNQQP